MSDTVFETPEIVYFPTLMGYAREVEKLTSLRRMDRIARHFDKEGMPDTYLDMHDNFYNKVKFELHVNASILQNYVETGKLEGTRFQFEGDLGLEDHPVFYGSVRTHQPPAPFRLIVDPFAASQAGLFFPQWPGIYPDKLEFARNLTAFDGLASLVIAQGFGLVRGDYPHMILLLDELELPLEDLIQKAFLPESSEYNSVAFLMRRRGINVRRIDYPSQTT